VLVEAGWTVVGTDVAPELLAAAREEVPAAELVVDDLFATRLEPGSFDLVHARFVLAPLGRWDEQLDVYRRLLRPGGVLALEEPDSGSWHFNPPAPSAERVIALILEAFRALPSLLRELGATPQVAAHVIALAPGDPYLQLPLQFARSLGERLDGAETAHSRSRRGDRRTRALGHDLHGRPGLGDAVAQLRGRRENAGRDAEDRGPVAYVGRY
jgi:SAM-dependent methyltransferase